MMNFEVNNQSTTQLPVFNREAVSRVSVTSVTLTINRIFSMDDFSINYAAINSIHSNVLHVFNYDLSFAFSSNLD